MEPVSLRRQQADQNRQLLVDATLDSIAELGIAATSVSEIIQRAGLSRGMIHLHFGGKDNLLVEAVKQTGEAYYRNLDRYLQQSGSYPQGRIEAVINCDLSEEVLNSRTVNIWYAFRGEARQRGKIARYTDTRDRRLNNTLRQSFLDLANDQQMQDPNDTSREVTRGTLAMLEGMWGDFLLHPDAFDRVKAKRVIFRFLTGLFPQVFTVQGSI